ncbi:MAG: VWA domain-containing protein [Proteobacteria bacterium]|nr:VWA domain-containing protein [Pseudomonadota bacterium]
MLFSLITAAFAGPQLTWDAGLDVEALAPAAFHEQWLVVDVQAPEITREVAPGPTHISVILDTSGSMQERGKLEYAKKAAASLVERLGPGDTLSLVGFGSEPQILRRQGRILNPAEVLYGLGLLTAQGGTHIYGGLSAGLDQLQRYLEHPRRRILVLSDGEATAGPTDRRSLAGMASDAQAAGITVSTVGLGLEFDAPTLIAIADAGGGVYGNDPEPVVALFDDELKRMQEVAALSATVDLQLADGVELIEVLGYEEYDGMAIDGGWRVLLGDMQSGEPRNVVAKVRVPATEVGAKDVANVRIRWRDAQDGTRTEIDGKIRTTIAADPHIPGNAAQAAQVLEETIIEFSDADIEDELRALGYYQEALQEEDASDEEEDRRAMDYNRDKALEYMY